MLVYVRVDVSIVIGCFVNCFDNCLWFDFIVICVVVKVFLFMLVDDLLLLIFLCRMVYWYWVFINSCL